jgi:anti-anti-sigma factor
MRFAIALSRVNSCPMAVSCSVARRWGGRSPTWGKMNRIVVDVAGLKQIDSTFLCFLVRLREHAARDQSATVELVGATPRLRRTLQITGLARAFVFTSDC